MLLLLLLLAVAIGGSHGQFPRVCMTKEAMKSKICCPLWNGSQCGIDAKRGKCGDSGAPTLAYIDPIQLYDDRLNWPLGYFDFSCRCSGNYAGFNCGKCKFGYYGKYCNQKKTIVRREIRELSTIERRRFFSYITLAKYTISKDFVILVTGDRHHNSTYKFINATIYDIFSWIHYYSMSRILENSTFTSKTNYAHQGPAFPGWHRRLLLFLEREIQELVGDEDFALPYYDWSHENNTCSICNEEFLGDNDLQGNIVGSSYFSSWGDICSGYFYTDAYCRSAERGFHVENLLRKPGRDPLTRIPTYQDVEATLKWEKFDTEPFDATSTSSFRNALEGFLNPHNGRSLEQNMHNMFHLYIGGTMSQVPISANDPIFMLHHAYIDKLFELWIQKNKATPDTYPKNDHKGHRKEECAVPFFPCETNMHMLQCSAAFGYTYTYMDQASRPFNQKEGEFTEVLEDQKDGKSQVVLEGQKDGKIQVVLEDQKDGKFHRVLEGQKEEKIQEVLEDQKDGKFHRVLEGQKEGKLKEVLVYKNDGKFHEDRELKPQKIVQASSNLLEKPLPPVNMKKKCRG